MKPIQAVGAVVYRVTARGAIEVLLLRKCGAFWTLPKGKLKRGESHDTALLREVLEETGISGAVEDLVAQARYMVKKASPRLKVVTYYLVHAQAGVPTPEQREGIEEVCWVSLANALLRVRRRRLCTILRAAQTMLSTLPV